MREDGKRAIGIIAHPQSQRIAEKARHLMAWLDERGVAIKTRPDFARLVGCPALGFADEEIVRGIELMLVLGGDGSFLGAARLAAPAGVPILGVDMGSLGFLTEVRLGEVEAAMAAFLSGAYSIDERLMLQARVVSQGKERLVFRAMNDIVVAKGSFSRMIRFRTYVDNRYLATYAADGLIISTPTGSTAYSLSAGGPVVNPNLKVIIVTPICPHTLYARSLVLSSHEEIKVLTECEERNAMITVDGQECDSLQEGDTVLVGEAPYMAKVVKLHERSFYAILRNKLKWGGDHRVPACERGV